MTIEKKFALWELGTLFQKYYSIVGSESSGSHDATPADAIVGIEAGNVLIERPAPGQTPTGIITWSRQGGEWWIDFCFSFEDPAKTGRPRGATLLQEAMKEIFHHSSGRGQSGGVVKCDFARQLVAADYDFFSPLASMYGMERSDELLLTRPEGKPVEEYPLPKGYRFGTFNDGNLDGAVSVMLRSPDPSRLIEWSEQLCRDEILWALSSSRGGGKTGQGLSVWHEGRMTGFILATDSGLISQVHVLPECQNKGVGSSLMSEMLKRLSHSETGETSLLADDTNGEMLRLAERFDFETALRYPLWSWKKVHLDKSTLDLLWTKKVKKQEISDLYFRSGSPTFKKPALLQTSFNKANVRLAVRQYGELLAIAKGTYDGTNTVIITGFVVDRLYRRQGIGCLMYKAITEKYSNCTSILFELSAGSGIEENGTDFLRSMGLGPAPNIWSH